MSTIRLTDSEIAQAEQAFKNYRDLINEQLDLAGAPKVHSSNGSALQKPMIPTERIAALGRHVAAQEEKLEMYRKLVGKLATNPDKASAWYTAKTWAGADFWRGIAFDLKSPEEQQAFLFH